MTDEPVGTLRRSPFGFAHAILLDHHREERRWMVIDVYGDMSWAEPLRTDQEVAGWPVVYTPAPDEEWNASRSVQSGADERWREKNSDDAERMKSCER